MGIAPPSISLRRNSECRSFVDLVVSGTATPVVELRRYDRLGRLLGVKDPGGSLWSYDYDLRGLRLKAIDPDLGEWFYNYDVGGRLLTQKDLHELTTTTILYDPLNRVSSKKTVRQGGELNDVVNVYDEVRPLFFNKGHLTTSTRIVGGTSVASQSFDYDGEGRLRKEGWIVGGTDHGFSWTIHAPGGEVI
jgi:YD repeat-containing protein